MERISAVKKKHHYQYKNLTLFFIGIFVALLLYRFERFHEILLSFGSLGYVGAFIAGILFVSSFAAATGIVVLLVLAEELMPVEIALFAGIGAVCGDLLIFRFFKDNLIGEVKPLFKRFGGQHLKVLLHSRYFNWSLPFVGALIIASPLPDEIGVSLMGLSKMSTFQFLVLSFVLNSIGIFLVVSASTFIKP